MRSLLCMQAAGALVHGRRAARGAGRGWLACSPLEGLRLAVRQDAGLPGSKEACIRHALARKRRHAMAEASGRNPPCEPAAAADVRRAGRERLLAQNGGMKRAACRTQKSRTAGGRPLACAAAGVGMVRPGRLGGTREGEVMDCDAGIRQVLWFELVDLRKRRNGAAFSLVPWVGRGVETAPFCAWAGMPAGRSGASLPRLPAPKLPARRDARPGACLREARRAVCHGCHLGAWRNAALRTPACRPAQREEQSYEKKG